MIAHDCFTLKISVQDSMPVIDSSGKTVFEFPKSRWFHVFNPTLMRADPFLFVKDGTLYLFYEYMGFSHGAGSIMMTSTKDLKTWAKPVPITYEPHTHFSYPFVFEADGEIFMMPETGCDHNIRLYKAENGNLTDFRLHKTILERSEEEREDLKYDYADNCIYKKDGVYHLFTSIYKDNRYYLELYTSDRVDGQYVRHPMSPVCEGNKYGRCAGSLIEAGGRLYRPAQDCENEYGGQVHLLEIAELSPVVYKEHPVHNDVLPRDIYRTGGHQLNFASFDGKIIAATDEKYHCTFFLERVRLKLMRLLGLR